MCLPLATISTAVPAEEELTAFKFHHFPRCSDYVGTYTRRAYENPYMGYHISTLIGSRKLCSLVISMLMSILQDVGTYTGRAYENPYMGCLISTLIGSRKLCSLVISMLMSILQNVGTYMCVLCENPYMGYLISMLIGSRKLCSLVINMLMSILRRGGTHGFQMSSLPKVQSFFRCRITVLVQQNFINFFP